MSDLSTTATEATVKWRDREFVLTRPNDKTQMAFAVFLEGRALEAIERHRAKLSKAGYSEALGEWMRSCAAGHYACGGAVAVSAVHDSDACFQELLRITLCQKSEVAPEEMDLLYQDKFAELFGAWQRVNGVTPTAPAQETQPANAPVQEAQPANI